MCTRDASDPSGLSDVFDHSRKVVKSACSWHGIRTRSETRRIRLCTGNLVEVAGED